jgi:hypothetical protein
MTPDEARRAAASVGAATLVIGAALVARPDQVRKLARMEDSAGLRVIGVADLALVPGLLAGRPRRPWMIARAGLNAAIVAFLLGRPVDEDTVKRRAVSAVLGLVTVQDLRVARALNDGG